MSEEEINEVLDIAQEGVHQELRNQNTLMRSGLLEQEGINDQEIRTGQYWNAIMQVTPVEEVK